MSGLRRGEDGFTLPELLMAITILAIIIVPLTGSLFTGLRTADRTASILASSADRQRLSLYFPPDVASASAVDTAAGAWGCAGAAPAGTTNVVQLTWHEFNAAGSTPVTTLVTSFVADYRLVQVGTEWQMTRYACTAGGAATPVDIAHHLPASTAATVSTSGTTVALTLTDTLGTQYTVSGSRRSA